MIAYNRIGLDSRIIRQQADEAFAAGCISPDEKTKISAAYPIPFYTPNIFICIGLFLLTIVIASFSLGLFFLISAGNSGSIVPLLIFSAFVCYAALEFVINKRRHFKSGVDYALMWMSAGLLCSAIFLSIDNISTISLCLTICIVSLLFTLRFANMIMALVFYTTFLALIINITAELSRTAQMITPFILMAVSVGIWFLCIRLHRNETCRHYRPCLAVLKAACLTSFYLAGNYFVVRELGSSLLGVTLHTGDSISLGWLFWMLTVTTPILYIYHGIRKKDPIFLWVGLGLIAATVFTIRYYYRVLPAEWAMITGGIVTITISYVLIKYLKTPRYGFTSREQNNKHVLENLHIESLVIAETFSGSSSPPAANNDFQFGGGSGGGGGAGGQF